MTRFMPNDSDPLVIAYYVLLAVLVVAVVWLTPWAWGRAADEPAAWDGAPRQDGADEDAREAA